jgi:hypothetical protein
MERNGSTCEKRSNRVKRERGTKPRRHLYKDQGLQNQKRLTPHCTSENGQSVLARYWIGLPLRSFFPGISFNREVHCENYGVYYYRVISSCRKNGNQILTKFTVETTFREIYNFLLEEKAQKSRVALKNKSVDYVDLWKRFYATSLSPEAKETWFKIIHDILPVKERLFRFHITSDPMCAVCTEGRTESVGHLLLECIFSRKARVLCFQLIGDDVQRRCNIMDINFFTKEFFNSNAKAII